MVRCIGIYFCCEEVLIGLMLLMVLETQWMVRCIGILFCCEEALIDWIIVGRERARESMCCDIFSTL